MKWLLHAVAVTVLATAITSSAGTTARAAVAAVPAPQTLASWTTDPFGSFAESMTLGKDGALYVSRTIWGEDTNVGEIDRVPLDGGPVTALVSGADTGYGLFTGVASDPEGRLYVAVASFIDGSPTGVMRVEPNGKLKPILELPTGAFPNGLAFFDGDLYVTDPLLGAIWRVQVTGKKPILQTEPWLVDPALAPVTDLGPDGIAFRGRTMYVTQYDRGQILTATIARDGTPGTLHVFADDPALVTADGVAFDRSGNLWVTVNGDGAADHGRIALVTRAGGVVVLADNTPWLDYPTQPVLTQSGLYVSNGSFGNGLPSVVGWQSLAG